MLQHLTSVFKL